jgi:hypothetical protein
LAIPLIFPEIVETGSPDCEDEKSKKTVKKDQQGYPERTSAKRAQKNEQKRNEQSTAPLPITNDLRKKGAGQTTTS